MKIQLLYLVVFVAMVADAFPGKDPTLENHGNGQRAVKVKSKRAKDQASFTITKVFTGFGKSYVYSNKTSTWKASRDLCKSIGGDLASIYSYKEFRFILKSMAGVGKRYWLSGRKTGDNEDGKDIFAWSTGEPIPSKHSEKTFDIWYPEDPNDIADRDCIIMWENKGIADANCEWAKDNSVSFLCEIDQIDSLDFYFDV